YMTESTYNPITGSPDSNDATAYNPTAPSVTAPPSSGGYQNQFGNLNMSAGTGVTIILAPSTNDNDVFKGILFYQRRASTQTASITGSNSGIMNVSGTIYGQWMPLQISGGGSYNAQFVVGTMSVSGSGIVTVGQVGSAFGKANQVFLLE